MGPSEVLEPQESTSLMVFNIWIFRVEERSRSANSLKSTLRNTRQSSVSRASFLVERLHATSGSSAFKSSPSTATVLSDREISLFARTLMLSLGVSDDPVPHRKEERNLVKRRKLLAGQRCDLPDNGWVCCERRRYINWFDKDLNESRRSAILGKSYFERKSIVESMLQVDGSFRFKGVKVCQTFVTQVLSFSNSVIAAVK